MRLFAKLIMYNTISKLYLYYIFYHLFQHSCIYMHECIRVLELRVSSSICFRCQKNGVVHEVIVQSRNHTHLRPVVTWVNIIRCIWSYPGTTDKIPVNTVHLEYTQSTFWIEIISNYQTPPSHIHCKTVSQTNVNMTRSPFSLVFHFAFRSSLTPVFHALSCWWGM